APQREDTCVMLAARTLRHAVKWIEDRQENLMSAGAARHEHGEVAMAFDDDGRILAATIEHVQNVGAYPIPSPLTSSIAVGMLFARPLGVAWKWIRDRQEILMSAGAARHDHGEVAMAFDDDGRILAATLEHVQNVGAYPIPTPPTSSIAVGMLFPGPYRVPEA